MNTQFLKDLITKQNQAIRDEIIEAKGKRGLYGVLKGNTITYQDEKGTVRTVNLEDVK